jgi:ADP-heptose:LPS heptosyltransferase
MSAKINIKGNRHPERGNRVLKIADYFAGIPLVFITGLFRRKRPCPPPGELQKAAFLQTAAIGDTVLSSAIVRAFKKSCPRAHITFFTGASNYEAALLISGIDRLVKLPIKNPLRALKEIRNSGPFDVWIDFGPWPRLNVLFTAFSKAAFTVGFKTPGQHRHYAYDAAVEHSSQVHELENYRSLLRRTGIGDAASLPLLNLAASSLKKNQIVVHMFPGGSKSSLKEWPALRWIALIDELAGRGYAIVLTGAPVDRERALALKELVRRPERVHVAAGSQTLKEAAELISISQLTISVDTGIMHLASALGAGVLSLHGPTSPKRWGPLNSNSIALHSSIHCSPCLSLGFESACGDPQCMAELSVEEAVAAVDRILHHTS